VGGVGCAAAEQPGAVDLQVKDQGEVEDEAQQTADIPLLAF
jgi:hypothetical protein